MTGLHCIVMSWLDEDLDGGPVPLWFQIAQRLRTAIEKGEFRAGDLLPSESVLNRRFGVSRTTSRSALDCLEQEGRITRRSGKGSIVLPGRLDQPLDFLGGFAEDMRARGYEPSYRTRSVTIEQVDAEVAERLAIPSDSRAIMVHRVLLTNSSPIAVSRVCLAPWTLRGRYVPTPEELDRRSLYEWLSEVADIRIANGEEFIEASIADAELATDLDIAVASPVLVVRRISRTAEGKAAEYVVSHYRADRYRFKVALNRL